MTYGHHTQLPQLRFVALICRVAFMFFTALLVWQLLVLATGSYPEHIQPVVKLLSGTEQVVPVAYAWTIRLGLITIAGFFASLTGWFVARHRLRNKRS
jgi:ABC-type sulfate transport system permease component